MANKLYHVNTMQTGTAHVVWSFSTSDPSDPFGESVRFHDYKGALCLNLLGGFTDPPSDPDDLQSFDFRVSNVSLLNNADSLQHGLCSYQVSLVVFLYIHAGYHP